jgi:hypothetical protein
VVALASEMPGAMNIETIAWQRGTGGSASGTYNSFKLYMGLCASDELGAAFDDNYIPGSRILVYETPSQTMSADPDQWMTIALDTPYWYNGTDNLILELEWTGGVNMFYTYWWETGTNRSVIAESASAPSGTIGTSMSELQGTGSLGLDAVTFGEVKFLLGQ